MARLSPIYLGVELRPKMLRPNPLTVCFVHVFLIIHPFLKWRTTRLSSCLTRPFANSTSSTQSFEHLTT